MKAQGVACFRKRNGGLVSPKYLTTYATFQTTPPPVRDMPLTGTCSQGHATNYMHSFRRKILVCGTLFHHHTCTQEHVSKCTILGVPHPLTPKCFVLTVTQGLPPAPSAKAYSVHFMDNLKAFELLIAENMQINDTYQINLISLIYY